MAPRSQLRAGALLLAALSIVPPAWSAPRLSSPQARPRPAGPAVQDFARRFDANRLDLFVTNVGTLGFDVTQFAPGLLYPRGANTSVLFASGLWITGTVDGQERGAIAEYSWEYEPGTAAAGSRDDPSRTDFRTYKVRTAAAAPADTDFVSSGTGDPVLHGAWSDYVANAGPLGAPVRVHALPDPNDPQQTIPVDGPDLPGDLALWNVFNDLDPLSHGSGPGGTAPLGVEVRQAVYGFDDAGPLGDASFVDWTITNASNKTIEGATIAFWADPDLGTFSDDLAGWDSARAMAYAYNGKNVDGQYGAAVPALGVVLLRGPGAVPAGPLAFVRYVNGSDPNSITETIRSMHGLKTDGSPFVNPLTGLTTAFPYDGDPVAGSGWLDGNAADRRFLVSTGPVTLAPGEAVHVVYAVVVGQGANRFDSIAQLRCNADLARRAWSQGFTRPFPVATCTQVAACPRTSGFWAAECASPNVLSPDQVDIVAVCAADHAESFAPFAANETTEFCAGVSAPPNAAPRARAEREFLALLANQCAAENLLTPAAGPAIGLPLAAAISCPGIVATTVGELLAPAAPLALLDAAYVANAGHDAPIHGAAALPRFGGGAGTYFDFWGRGAIDPSAHPDSLGSVTIVFDATRPHPAYRYLRLEQGDGSAPTPGRAYRYGGYRDVPLYALDSATLDTLEVAFVERAVTDADGTLLDAGAQPATFDSTWSPSADADGGLEGLVVFRRPQFGAPRPEFAQDGAVANGSLPGLFALAAARDSASTVFQDGESFTFTWGRAATPGVDAQLLALAALPQGDPATLGGYEAIASCLATVNDGSAIGAACSPGTPALATLISSLVTADRVSLTWFAADPARPVFEVERRDGDGPWLVRAHAAADGTGRLGYEDTDVAPGQTLSYRLAQNTAAGRVTQGETTVIVPARTGQGGRVALAVRAKNGGDLMVDLALARAGQAKFEILTAAGRRVYAWDAGMLEAGRHAFALPGSGRLPGGFYLVRVRQADADAVAKSLVLR
jgi:hypothetical protein